jgi:hypothetical protein
MWSVRFRNPKAEPRRCSSRPSIASVRPVEVRAGHAVVDRAAIIHRCAGSGETVLESLCRTTLGQDRVVGEVPRNFPALGHAGDGQVRAHMPSSAPAGPGGRAPSAARRPGWCPGSTRVRIRCTGNGGLTCCPTSSGPSSPRRASAVHQSRRRQRQARRGLPDGRRGDLPIGCPRPLPLARRAAPDYILDCDDPHHGSGRLSVDRTYQGELLLEAFDVDDVDSDAGNYAALRRGAATGDPQRHRDGTTRP